MSYLGDLAEDALLYFCFTTRTTTGVPTALLGTPTLAVYIDDSITQSTVGITLTVSLDGVVGLNNVKIDTSADAFYAVGGDYSVVITAGTVGGVSVVGEVVGTFSIENRFDEVALKNGAHGGTAAVITAERIVVASTTAGEPALKLTGNTSGAGFLATGGSSGNGVSAVAGGGNTHGLAATGSGTGSGIRSTAGATGDGIYGVGGVTSGSGIRATVASGNSAGFRCSGGGSGPGISATGGTTGHGIHASGGATSGSGLRVEGVAGDGHGLVCVGQGAGSGIDSTGGATGDGMELNGGATSGNALECLVTSGNEIDANVTGNLSGSVGSVTGAVGSVTGAVGSVTGNVTGSVGSLATQAKADVNAEVDTALNTAIPLTPTTDSVNQRLVAIDDLTQASGGGDLAAILADTNELQGDWVNAGRLDTILDTVAADVVGLNGAAMRGTDSAALASVCTEVRLAELDAANLPATTDATLVDTAVIGAAGAGLTDLGGMSTTMKAQVNTEAVDALATDTYAQLGQGAPPATLSIADMLRYIFKAWRNKTTQTATQYSLYNDDAATVDQKATFADDGTTATRGEIATGP